jgi:putative transposase
VRENSIRAWHKRRYKATTDSKHTLPVADNLLKRNFTTTEPNQIWTSDITYLLTEEGWLYLAVVGWPIAPRMTADIVADARAGVSRHGV